MKTWIKWLIGGGLVAGAATLLSWKRFGERLQIIPQVDIDGVGLTWVRFQITPTIKNPSTKELKINYPFISLYHKGNLLGSSQVKQETITIPKLGEVKIGAPEFEPIKIKVSMDRLGSIFPLLTNLILPGVELEKGQIVLKIETQTRLFPEGANIAYKTSETIDLA